MNNCYQQGSVSFLFPERGRNLGLQSMFDLIETELMEQLEFATDGDRKLRWIRNARISAVAKRQLDSTAHSDFLRTIKFRKALS